MVRRPGQTDVLWLLIELLFQHTSAVAFPPGRLCPVQSSQATPAA